MNSNASKFFGMILTLGLTGMAIGFLIAMMEESHSNHDPTPAIAIVAGAVIFGVLLRGPVGRAIAKMLEGQSAPDDQLRQRVEQLEAQLYDGGVDIQRMSELENRLDFAERLLAQRNDQALLRSREHD